MLTRTFPAYRIEDIRRLRGRELMDLLAAAALLREADEHQRETAEQG